MIIMRVFLRSAEIQKNAGAFQRAVYALRASERGGEMSQDIFPPAVTKIPVLNSYEGYTYINDLCFLL